jgi:cell division protein ZipA
MDDLRWILLIVGIVVVAAVYFSSRFEQEDWARERDARKKPRKTPSLKPAKAQSIEPQSTESQVIETQMPAAQSTAPKPTSESAQTIVQQEAVTEPPDSAAETTAGADTEIAAPEPVEEHEDIDWEVAEPERHAPVIEDEIVEVEIPQDLVDLDKTAETSEEPAQEELPLDMAPLVLVLTVMAKDEPSFEGAAVHEALEAEGLKHGDMKIFHYHLEDKPHAIFSMANVVEPGYFELDELDQLHIPGLTLFCQLPGSLPGGEAFEMMLDKARGIAVRLHGQLCDDKRNVLTAQAITHYHDRIEHFNHELMLARKKAAGAGSKGKKK